jgi:outer membrane protein assembly factor BamB
VAYDPAGQLVARLGQSAAPGTAAEIYGFWRSSDGATIFTSDANALTTYAAVDGHLLHTYQHPVGSLLGNAFSRDGHYLTWLTFSSGQLRLDVLDLSTGTWVSRASVAHDSQASMPGYSGPPNSWGMPVFGPDSVHLYAVTDWGGPVRISAFTLESGQLQRLGTQVLRGVSCAGPAMALKVIDAGGMLAAFCHFDGAVWLVDLKTLSVATVLHPRQSNPFWASPVFTGDGRLLYLLEPGTAQVLDLDRRTVRGPFALPKTASDQSPLAALLNLLATPVDAGGVASTVPLSPDGLKLYVANPDGVMALRVPDLKPLAKLAPGLDANEVWVSGDGGTLYVTSADGRGLETIRADGTGVHRIDLPAIAGGFVASEHG